MLPSMWKVGWSLSTLGVGYALRYVLVRIPVLSPVLWNPGRSCEYRLSAALKRTNPTAACREEWRMTRTSDTWAEKIESFERINSIRVTNENFYSSNSCKRLVPSRLHEWLEQKFPFVKRIEFIRSKLSIFSAHVSGVRTVRAGWPWSRWVTGVVGQFSGQISAIVTRASGIKLSNLPLVVIGS